MDSPGRRIKGIIRLRRTSLIRINCGTGVPQDYVQSLKWLELAGRDSLPGDDFQICGMRACTEFGAKMTPQQIAEAQRLAREWKPNYVARRDNRQPDERG